MGDRHAPSAGAQNVGHQRGLGGFAGALDALKRDKSTGCHH